MDQSLQFIGMNIRQLRKMRKWTQEELARNAKISRIALIHIESGKASPTLETLSSLARVLEVPITYFFTVRPEAAEKIAAETEEYSAHTAEQEGYTSETEIQAICDKLRACGAPQVQAIKRLVDSIIASMPSEQRAAIARRAESEYAKAQ